MRTKLIPFIHSYTRNNMEIVEIYLTIEPNPKNTTENE